MFTLALNKTQLRAIGQFMAKDDARYYLNGVCIEAGETGARLIATDGHALGVIRCDEIPQWPEGFKAVEQVILPADVILKLKRSKHFNGMILTADPSALTFKLTDPYEGTEVSGKLLDGKFPDWRKVMPQTITGNASQINPALLMKFHKAAQILSDSTVKSAQVSVGHNGIVGKPRLSGACTVSIGHDCFAGVVMPYTVADPEAAPAWTQDTLTPAPLKLAA